MLGRRRSHAHGGRAAPDRRRRHDAEKRAGAGREPAGRVHGGARRDGPAPDLHPFAAVRPLGVLPAPAGRRVGQQSGDGGHARRGGLSLRRDGDRAGDPGARLFDRRVARVVAGDAGGARRGGRVRLSAEPPGARVPPRRREADPAAALAARPPVRQPAVGQAAEGDGPRESRQRAARGRHDAAQSRAAQGDLQQGGAAGIAGADARHPDRGGALHGAGALRNVDRVGDVPRVPAGAHPAVPQPHAARVSAHGHLRERLLVAAGRDRRGQEGKRGPAGGRHADIAAGDSPRQRRLPVP